MESEARRLVEGALAVAKDAVLANRKARAAAVSTRMLITQGFLLCPAVPPDSCGTSCGLCCWDAWDERRSRRPSMLQFCWSIHFVTMLGRLGTRLGGFRAAPAQAHDGLSRELEAKERLEGPDLAHWLLQVRAFCWGIMLPADPLKPALPLARQGSEIRALGAQVSAPASLRHFVLQGTIPNLARP